jgi:hypothetical protein
MWSKILRAGIVAGGLGIAFVPVGLQAQAATETAPAAAPAQAPAEAAAAPAQGPVASAATIAARIQAVQRQAMQDPALTAANREISTMITAALPRVEPNYATYAARAQSIQADVTAAREASDNAKLNALAEETKQLQANITAAQEKAKADPAVKQKLDEFKVKLFTKMVQIDPQVQELVKQLEALQAQGAGSGS